MGEEKIIERMKKLYNLALRGVENEKDNARNLLNALAKKYNINIDEIMDIANIQQREINYRTKEEMQILYHTIGSRLGFDIKVGKYRQKNTLVFEASFENYIYIQEYYIFLKNIWKQELQNFLHAFVIKYQIASPAKENQGSEMTREDIEKMMEVSTKIASIQKKQFLKSLKGV